MERSPGLKLIEPVGYLDMLTLNRNARMIITDSGGLQEEATVLGVPCITVRHNTERPATVEAGANQVVGNRPDAIRAAMQAVRVGKRPNIHIPKLWDGMTSGRIVDVLTRLYRRD
jgi:UDP-N-acetylglucosamine 2-epimerase (non-hydrolysing)